MDFGNQFDGLHSGQNMGVFNQDMSRNSYPKKDKRNKKKRGMIDMISIIQMKYTGEKTGAPLPSDLITTGHNLRYQQDLFAAGLTDIVFTFLIVSMGIIFMAISGSFYFFRHYSILNYLMGGFIFAIPGSVYGFMIASTIWRYYEIKLTNTAKMIRLVFQTNLFVQIFKIIIPPAGYFLIFRAISRSAWINRYFMEKLSFFGIDSSTRNDKAFFFWYNAWSVLTDRKYRTLEEIIIDLLIGIFITLLPGVIAMIYKSKKTKNMKNTAMLRGQAVETRNDKNVFHESKFDIVGTMITGTTGAGKTTLLNQIITDRMATLPPSSKWIFTDISGEYMGAYYRQGDVIIDTTDERCALWNFLEEINNPAVIKNITCNIIPEDSDVHGNRFFSDAARRILNDALMACFETGNTDNMGVKRQLIYQPKESFEEIKKLAGDNKINFTDIYNTYKNFVEGILYINTEGEPFNLTNWLLNPDDLRRVFLVYHEDTLDSQKGFLTLFITLFTNRVLSQDFNNPGRINVVIDELANIGLIDTLPRTLSLCRKKKIAFYLAAQTIMDVKRIYVKRFNNLMENINNFYAFAANDGETAETLANMFGKIEKKELMANTAVSTEYDQEHTTTYSTSIRETHLILPNEFLSLPNFTYYAKFLTDAGRGVVMAHEEEIQLKRVNNVVYKPANHNYHKEIKLLEKEILFEVEEQEKIEKEHKKKKEQPEITRKDLNDAVKKINKITAKAVEPEKPAEEEEQ
jgi:type IV secretory pathway TraG/TraD family ATPase VirD4